MMPPPLWIEGQLIEYLNEYLERKGVSLDSGVRAEFENFANRAGLDTENLDANLQRQKLNEAKRAFAKTIDAMIVAAKEIPGYIETEGNVLRQQTLAIAWVRLCPIWPIC